MDSVFTGNFVSDIASWSSVFNYYDGGGVVVYGDGASISLASSEFTGNGAEMGGAASFEGNNTITVKGCRFEDNLANNAGGAVAVRVRTSKERNNERKIERK